MTLNQVAATLAAQAINQPTIPAKKLLSRGLALSLLYWPPLDGFSGWCLKIGRYEVEPSDKEVQIVWSAFQIPKGATMSNAEPIKGWMVVGIEWAGYGEQKPLFETVEERQVAYE